MDPGERTIDAAAREVHEETGLEVDSLELLCMWESCFPTRVDLGALRRHTLMLVYRARVKGHAGLRLQADEVDMAAWVPIKQVRQSPPSPLSPPMSMSFVAEYHRVVPFVDGDGEGL